MHNSEFKPGRYTKAFRRLSVLFILLWTGLLTSSVVWNLYQYDQTLIETARVMGRIAFQKDILYRSWNSNHGGVYVPITDTTQPNPYLTGIPDVIIAANNGKKYTLMNPAYMTRQVFELQKEATGILGHITSLKPIRPANAADAWETKALMSFEIGSLEESSVEILNGQSYLRLMQPLAVSENCLGCHATQGYKIGEIRGGISESVPLVPLQNASETQRKTLILGHGFIWLMGMLGIIFSTQMLKQSINLQQKAEENLVRMSMYDSLTGLFNRSYFEDTFKRIDDIKFKPVTVLSADLDNLKKTNDTLGHSAGDHLLQGAAEVLKSSFRSQDIISRTGGDEFVVILMGGDLDQIEKTVGRVRARQDEWNKQNPDLDLSISIGAATTSPKMNLSDALKLADERMYANKAKNKSRKQ